MSHVRPLAAFLNRTGTATDARTSSEIIVSMERRVASPEYAAERDAFMAGVNQRTAIENAKHEARWARERQINDVGTPPTQRPGRVTASAGKG